MYYDLNLGSGFTDYAELESVDFIGFCQSTEATGNLRQLSPPKISTEQEATYPKPIYSRINVEYSNKIDPSTLSHLFKFDVVCIKGVNQSNINSVIKANPDVIGLKLEDIRHIKKTFINLLKIKSIFVEICIKDALYSSKDRILWMNSLRRLIKLGCTKNLIISSGATVFTELKTSHDICKLLNIFNLSDDNIRKILLNSEGVLRKAALKRYTSRGVCADNEREGRLKDDFILNYHRKAN